MVGDDDWSRRELVPVRIRIRVSEQYVNRLLRLLVGRRRTEPCRNSNGQKRTVHWATNIERRRYTSIQEFLAFIPGC